MALSGSLHDFDLSYIFQIISQEGKTGRLVLSGDHMEGDAVFRDGRIVSACDGFKDLRRILLTYIADMKGFSQLEVKELDKIFLGDTAALAEEVIVKQYISRDELHDLLEPGLEDLACSLFTWTQGVYRFDVLPNVDKYVVDNIIVSTDAIMMEAARRVDEMQRMQMSIQGGTVFVRAESLGLPRAPLPPLDVTSEYLCGFMDGTSNVDFMVRNSYLSEYSIYELLSELLRTERIVPLGDKLSQSITDALHRKAFSAASEPSQFVLAAVGTAALVFLMMFAGMVSIRNGLLGDVTLKKKRIEQEADLRRMQQNADAAVLLYRGLRGRSADDYGTLIRAGYLSRRDIPPPPQR